MHGDGALEFEGQAEIENLAWHGAGQDNSSREQLGIIRGIPRVGFDKQRFCAVFLGNSRKHGVLGGLIHQAVQHKAAGQKQAGTLHMLRQGNGQKHPADDGFFFLHQAFQQLRFGYRYQLVYAKNAAPCGVFAFHRAAAGAVAPVAVGAAGVSTLLIQQVLVRVQRAAKGIFAQGINPALPLQVAP